MFAIASQENANLSQVSCAIVEFWSILSSESGYSNVRSGSSSRSGATSMLRPVQDPIKSETGEEPMEFHVLPVFFTTAQSFCLFMLFAVCKSRNSVYQG